MTIRVLVVDDSPTTRYKATKLFESHGMEVEQARSGEEAARLLPEGHRIDVVVTDLMMPGLLDGEKLIECLQNTPHLCMLPVVVITGKEGAEVQLENVERGASAYFNKPWDDDLLVATVRRLAQLKTRVSALTVDSRTDVLTGLCNRRHGAERLAEVVSRSQRYRRPLAAVLLDIDHFKRVNDSYGHGAGDEVLRHVAERLRATSRASDVVVRWGGEEFLFLFPETDLSQAAGIVERFREELAGAPVGLATAGITLDVTVSGGAAELEPDDTPESLVERADEALYRAKEEGRNRLMALQLGKLIPIRAA